MKTVKVSKYIHDQIAVISDKSGIKIQDVVDILLQRGIAEFESDVDGLKETMRSIYEDDEIVSMSMEATNAGIDEYNKFLKRLTRDERKRISGFIKEHKQRAENITYNEKKRVALELIGAVYNYEIHGREV